jgi:PEP-CTERM putative exosortase interaction domain
MTTRISPLFVLGVLVFAAPATGSAQVISTLDAPVLAHEFTSAGEFGWGQIFRAPDGVETLEQFAVKLNGGTGHTFEAFISEWTFGASGMDVMVETSSLAFKWSSGPVTAAGDFLTFDVGNLVLEAATSYAFYLITTSGLDLLLPMVGPAADQDGGAFFWSAGINNVPTSGYIYGDIFDMQFEATFSAISNAISPVPEPGTYATIGLAVCGTIALVQRRRRVKMEATAVAG